MNKRRFLVSAGASKPAKTTAAVNRRRGIARASIENEFEIRGHLCYLYFVPSTSQNPNTLINQRNVNNNISTVPAINKNVKHSTIAFRL